MGRRKTWNLGKGRARRLLVIFSAGEDGSGRHGGKPGPQQQQPRVPGVGVGAAHTDDGGGGWVL